MRLISASGGEQAFGFKHQKTRTLVPNRGMLGGSPNLIEF